MGVFMLCEFYLNLKGKKGNLEMFPLLLVLESEDGHWQVPRLGENGLPWEERDTTELRFSSQRRSMAGWENPAQIKLGERATRVAASSHTGCDLIFGLREGPDFQKEENPTSQKHNTHCAAAASSCYMCRQALSYSTNLKGKDVNRLILVNSTQNWVSVQQEASTNWTLKKYSILPFHILCFFF